MNKDATAAYAAVERLRDGRPATIRAIRPDDKGLVTEALRGLSAESIYFRLFSAKKEFTADDVSHITDVDFVNVVALVVVLPEDGVDRIVGGGRYIRSGAAGSGGRAEVAFLVDDAHRGLGIASRLFKHLIALARASGIAQFEAEVLPSNEAMLRVFARSGIPVATTAQSEVVHVVMDLTGDEGRGTPADHARP